MYSSYRGQEISNDIFHDIGHKGVTFTFFFLRPRGWSDLHQNISCSSFGPEVLIYRV